MPNKKVTIVIRGGTVSEVYSDDTIELLFLNFDSFDEFANHKLEKELQKTQEGQKQIF